MMDEQNTLSRMFCFYVDVNDTVYVSIYFAGNYRLIDAKYSYYSGHMLDVIDRCTRYHFLMIDEANEAIKRIEAGMTI